MANPVDRCLCLFARTPERGRVKRRLAASLGEDGALAAHEELLGGVLARCLEGRDYQVTLWLTDLAGAPEWLTGVCGEAGVMLRQQGRGDLGARMQECLQTELAESRYCVLIGSDCPDIDATYVSAAFKALAAADVVFGPAEDGGYGLIGLSRPAPELFDGMRWGDDQVLSRSLERAERSDMSVVCLPEIYDVDRIEDWERYRASSPAPLPGTETG